MNTYIKNATIITDGKIIEGKGVLVKDGKIIDLLSSQPNDCKVVDLDGKYIAPGFVDLHCHGGDGSEFIDGTEEAVIKACSIHAKHGTKVLYPTISATDYDTMVKSLEAIEKAKDSANLIIAGVHLEGPYLSPDMCGAQNGNIIRKPNAKEYESLYEKFATLIKRWSYAPEKDMDGAFLKFLTKNNITPSTAHSNAKYEHVLKAYEGGNKLVTHLYSCTSTIVREGGFRKLGVIESTFLLDGMYAEMIGDGRHLPPELLRMIFKIKGADKLCLVTDAIRYAGSGENGQVYDGEIPYLIEDGVAKLADRSAFAGSIATTECIVKSVTEAGIPLKDVVTMLTKTPATVMGLDGYGSIQKGYNAIFTVLDKDLNVVNVEI